MELWIRSQDKTSLLLAQKIMVDGKWIEVNGLEFGIYETQEQALKVLNDLQKLLEERLMIKKCKVEDGVVKFYNDFMPDNNQVQIIRAQTIVYQMPSIKEVKQ